MTRPLCILFPLLFIIAVCSCRKDFEYDVSTGNLEFSRDTVYLDTVFSTIGSSTYGFKVYNRSNKDIEIPIIKLEKGTNSGYRLNVDGMPGKEFQNVPLLAKDSMYVFVEITLDITVVGEKEFIYTDVIEFDSGANQQEVQLVTLVKDAIFLFPGQPSNGLGQTLYLGLDEAGNEIRIDGFELRDGQLQFSNEKPYVIYGYAAVPEEKELTIPAGARVYFHKDSGILVKPKGSLKIKGELSTDSVLLEKEVIFEGDRLEPAFENMPGQWGAIWLLPESVNHEISHLTIKNATVGLLVEGAAVLDSLTLFIANSRIYNSSITNLWARSAKIHGENLVLGGAGNTSLYCNQGGDYTFLHCTVANYWAAGIRTGPAMQIDNYSDGTNGTQGRDLIKADFTNCIIDGNRSQELFFNALEDYQFNFRFSHGLIRYRDTGANPQPNPLYDFEDPNRYISIVLNQDPTFLDASRNDFRIGENSAAVGKAEMNTAFRVPLDILGNDRTGSLDIGAFSIRF